MVTTLILDWSSLLSSPPRTLGSFLSLDINRRSTYKTQSEATYLRRGLLHLPPPEGWLLCPPQCGSGDKLRIFSSDVTLHASHVVGAQCERSPAAQSPHGIARAGDCDAGPGVSQWWCWALQGSLCTEYLYHLTRYPSSFISIKCQPLILCLTDNLASQTSSHFSITVRTSFWFWYENFNTKTLPNS